MEKKDSKYTVILGYQCFYLAENMGLINHCVMNPNDPMYIAVQEEIEKFYTKYPQSGNLDLVYSRAPKIASSFPPGTLASFPNNQSDLIIMTEKIFSLIGNKYTVQYNINNKFLTIQ